MNFYKKHKGKLNIIFNALLIAVLFYFVDFQALKETLLAIHLFALCIGLFLAIAFSVISAQRWYYLFTVFDSTNAAQKSHFISVTCKKEFFATFTSGLIGDIYSILAVPSSSRVNLTRALLLTRYYDVMVVLWFCLFPLGYFGYLPTILFALSLITVSAFIIGLKYLRRPLEMLTRYAQIYSQRVAATLGLVEIPNERALLIAVFYTFVLWSIRAGVVLFTLLALGVKTNVHELFMVTFAPVLFSIIAFILPKTVAGDSGVVAVGLLVGIPYPILVSYILIHKFYLVAVVLFGFIVDLFIRYSFKKDLHPEYSSQGKA